ncbi:MAG: arylesterase [Alphaproteobacteria bacterium]|nr:arylesterase [Alphaproteobacteria bacterium]
MRAAAGAVFRRPLGWRVVMLLWLALIFAGLAAPLASAQDAPAAPLRLVALGDSLTAGLGLAVQDSFPVKLETALAQRGIAVAITNAGVSGDTASGGLSRLDWSVPEGTFAVIVELGANDALRGIDPEVTATALTGIVTGLQRRGIRVLLCGMLAPPNNGPDFGRRFNAVYPGLAEKFKVPFYPFFLDGVAGHPALNQADGIHPTAEGVDVIVRNITPVVAGLLADAPKTSPESSAAPAQR